VIREGIHVTGLIRQGGRMTGVETAQGPLHADRVVLAAGVHAPELLAPLGLVLPLELRLVSVLQTVPLPPMLDQVLGVANADCAARQEIGGRLRVTTGIGPWQRPLEGWRAEDLHPSAADVALLGVRIAGILPAFRAAPLARLWGGLIDLTPDGLPVLDAPPETPGLVIAAGFSGHGFCLGPVTGRIVADLVLGRQERHPIAPFRLARFADPGPVPADLTLHG
jgi:sarcosine oxidase subunit beta